MSFDPLEVLFNSICIRMGFLDLFDVCDEAIDDHIRLKIIVKIDFKLFVSLSDPIMFGLYLHEFWSIGNAL